MSDEMVDSWGSKRDMIERPSRRFPARFDSECSGCGVEVEAGDLIRMWLGGCYHDDDTETCLPDEVRL